MAVFQDKITKTKDGRTWYFSSYYLDLKGNRKKYKSKKYLTKKEAQDKERIFQLELTDKIEAKNMTFYDLKKSYLVFQKNNVKITSYFNYNKYINLTNSLDNIKLNNFNIHHFNQWKLEILSHNYSNKYNNNIYKFLKSLLNYAKKYHDLNFNQIFNKMTGFSNPNELKKEMLFFSYEEFKKFINEEQELKYKAYFETLYYCGLRKGEANALNWNDIDFQKHVLIVNKNLSLKIKGMEYLILPPKTKSSSRIVPLPKILENNLELLKKEYEKYKNFSNSWFVYGGISPLKDTTVQNKKNNNCQKANVKQIRIHDFRHSCASLLINNGASITLVAKYLGHSNISTTLNTYTHMFKNELDDIIKIINNLEK